MPHDFHFWQPAILAYCIILCMYGDLKPSQIVLMGTSEQRPFLAKAVFEPRNDGPTFGPLGALCRLDAQHWALSRLC